MKKYIGILVIVLLPLLAWSQQDDDWNNFLQRRNFNEWKQQRNASFKAYKDSVNREFAKAMEKRWEEFQVFTGQRRPIKPEPEQLPVAIHDTVAKEPVSLPVDQIIPTPEARPVPPTENEYDNYADSATQTTYRDVDVNFYMHTIKFEVPVSGETMVLGGISERAVAKLWSDLSENGFEKCVIQLKEKSREYHLNDWAIYDMITAVAAETFPKRYAEQTVFVVWLANQLGMDAKVGRTGNQLLVLLSAKTTLYAVSYVRCNNETYYIFSCYPTESQEQSSISTYPVTFPTPTYPLDMNIDEPIHFLRQPSSVTYRSDFWGDVLPFQVNQNAIDFYSRYPQVDIGIYANAEMSEELKIWAERQMKPFLDELDEYEAVNVLLFYVQTEFDYATDIQQFGYEKPFFCEENFYYAKNDCEDRAILFAYLIRNLVGARIVLLDYPDHIATAVAFEDDSEIKGDYYLIDGRKYFVCDPTYIGANIGETMPQYRTQRANVILLKHQNNKQ